MERRFACSGLALTGAAVMMASPATASGSCSAATDRSGIVRTIGAWRYAWQRGDLDAYMACYAKDATIRDGGTFSYSDYYRRQRRFFARYEKNNKKQTVNNLVINLKGSTAVAKFDTWYFTGGGTQGFDERATETLKFRRAAGGRWLITEDTLTNQDGDI